MMSRAVPAAIVSLVLGAGVLVGTATPSLGAALPERVDASTVPWTAASLPAAASPSRRAASLKVDGKKKSKPERRAKFTFTGTSDAPQAVYAKFFRVTKKHRSCAATFDAEPSAAFLLSDDVVGEFSLRGSIHGVNLYYTGKYKVCAWLQTEANADTAASRDTFTFRVQRPRKHS